MIHASGAPSSGDHAQSPVTVPTGPMPMSVFASVRSMCPFASTLPFQGRGHRDRSSRQSRALLHLVSSPTARRQRQSCDPMTPLPGQSLRHPLSRRPAPGGNRWRRKQPLPGSPSVPLRPPPAAVSGVQCPWTWFRQRRTHPRGGKRRPSSRARRPARQVLVRMATRELIARTPPRRPSRGWGVRKPDADQAGERMRARAPQALAGGHSRD